MTGIKRWSQSQRRRTNNCCISEGQHLLPIDSLDPRKTERKRDSIPTREDATSTFQRPRRTISVLTLRQRDYKRVERVVGDEGGRERLSGLSGRRVWVGLGACCLKMSVPACAFLLFAAQNSSWERAADKLQGQDTTTSVQLVYVVYEKNKEQHPKAHD